MKGFKRLVPHPVRALGRVVLKTLKRPLNGTASAEQTFHDEYYMRLTFRRLEHLASLRLPIPGASVLELAAGIGDLTSFFLDRGCAVVSTDGRADNLVVLRRRYPSLDVRQLDLDNPVSLQRSFDIVFCYGALYHLSRPAEAIQFMRGCCEKMLLADTCVSFGPHSSLNPIAEPTDLHSQSITGQGCRPTRSWVFSHLKNSFPYVYTPMTQPWHEEYPIDWTKPPDPPVPYTRAIFVASQQPLDNPLLTEELLQKQIRQG